ncbi:MAG: gamma-glutamyl-gamma-aminobutyrate hydrolase family protein [Candidatus Eiseniibacteriota bacterium]
MAKPLIGICPSIKPRQKRGDAYFLFASYVDLVARNGGLPVILPLAATLEEAREVVGRVDGVLLTGGEDIDPARYGQAVRRPELLGVSRRNDSDAYYARATQERGTPALGICLGIQVMNVEFGGSLLQHIPEDLPGSLEHEEEDEVHDNPEHSVAIEDGTILARILGGGAAVVNSFHHQSVDHVAPGFRVAARSSDGVVEAIERGDHPFYMGVQWHPERMPDAPPTRRLVGAFLDAARGAPVKA